MQTFGAPTHLTPTPTPRNSSRDSCTLYVCWLGVGDSFAPGMREWLREAGSKEMSPFHDAKMLEALIYTTGPKPFPRPLSTITCWCLFVSLPIFQATP